MNGGQLKNLLVANSPLSDEVILALIGINEAFVKENMKIFPNPTAGIFTINSDFENPATLQIMDMFGKQVSKTYNINKGTNQIDASELSKGVYIINFTVGKNFYVERLIIN